MHNPLLDDAMHQVQKDVRLVSSKKFWSKFSPPQLSAMLVLGLSVLGIVSSIILVNQSSDIRQQAQVAYNMCITSSDSTCIGRQYYDGCLTIGGKPGLCSPESGNATSCRCKQLSATTTPVPTNTPIPTSTPLALRTNTPTRTPTPIIFRTNTPIPTNTLFPTNTATKPPLPTKSPSSTPQIDYYASTSCKKVGDSFCYLNMMATCTSATTATYTLCEYGCNTISTSPALAKCVPAPTLVPIDHYASTSCHFPGDTFCYLSSKATCTSTTTATYQSCANGCTETNDYASCNPVPTLTSSPKVSVSIAPRIATATPACVIGQCISGQNAVCNALGQIQQVTAGRCVLTPTPISVATRVTIVPTVSPNPNRCYFGSPQDEPGFQQGACVGGRVCVRNADGQMAWLDLWPRGCEAAGSYQPTAAPTSIVAAKPSVSSPTPTPKTIVINKGEEQKVVEVKPNLICSSTTFLSKVPLVNSLWVDSCTKEVTPTSDPLSIPGGTPDSQKIMPEEKPDNGPLCFDLPLLGLTGVCGGTKPANTSEAKPTPVQANQVALTSTPQPDRVMNDWYVDDDNQCSQLEGCEPNSSSLRCIRMRAQNALFSSFEECEYARAGVVGWFIQNNTCVAMTNQMDADPAVVVYTDHSDCLNVLVHPTPLPSVSECYDAEENAQGAYCRYMATTPDNCQFPTQQACETFIADQCTAPFVPSWEFDFTACSDFSISSGCVACNAPQNFTIRGDLFCQTTQLLRGQSWWDDACLVPAP